MYRLLFVCTANICRSPTAEQLARHRYGEELATVRSAGFLRSGEPSPDHLVQALDEVGVDGSYHRSNTVDSATLDAADLVLTMEGEHVQRATLLHRPAFAKTIPLIEAVDVAGRVGRRLTPDELIETVNRERNPSSYLTSQWDVDDPYRRKLRDYRRCVAEIGELVDRVYAILA